MSIFTADVVAMQQKKSEVPMEMIETMNCDWGR